MALSKEAMEAQRLYHREWQRKNKDKVRLYNERNWEKKAQEKRQEDSKED